MKVENTELEYFEDDEICLDFYLGKHSETKNQWAKRVWDNCKLYKDNNGLDLDGNKLPRVYARDPHELWEEKKRKRRAAFVMQCTGEDCDHELLTQERIKQDLKDGKKVEWGKSHNADAIMKLKSDAKYSYKTATERYHEEEAKDREVLLKIEKDIKDKVTVLRSKFDDETIAIIYPQGAGLL